WSSSSRGSWTSSRPAASGTSRSCGWVVTAPSSRSSPRSKPKMADVTETRRAIEAILMVAESPVEAQLLAQLLEVPVAQVTEVCRELSVEYETSHRGFAL